MSKVKVLFFAADPSLARPDGVALELANEMREIEYHVRQARYGHRLVLERHGAARADDLIDCMEGTDARVVHFSGHGGKQGLVLVARDGHSRHPVNAAALKQLFRTYHGPVRLAVLSACSSHPQAQAIAEVVGCAIGTSSAISDTAATTFNSRFYRAVANGFSVQKAFDDACMALQVHRVPEDEHPKLFLGKGRDPTDLVLVKTIRLVPLRVAAAGAACVLTSAMVMLPPSTVLPELTASDIACGTETSSDAIRRPATGLGIAGTTTPSDPSGSAEALANAKALYQARNYEEALPIFKQAAEAGNAEAMGCLGVIYMYGRGVEPDPITGFRWIHDGATQEERDPHAMYALGMAYLNGIGTMRREYLAEDWFQKAADKGYAEAMRSLGSLYQHEKNDSSYQKALYWYRRAVDTGSVDARVDIGVMFEMGLGTSPNPTAAFQSYRSAALAGSPRGMLAVGQSYEKGVGVPQDYVKAMTWYRRAAKGGNAEAMNSIGLLYDRGLGVRRSHTTAIRWYKRAAEAGSPLAKGNLGAFERD